MGALACLVSAVAFGAMAIFAKQAYAAGVDVTTLLLVRFGVAAAVLAVVAAASRRLRGLRTEVVVAGLLMGAVGYAAQSGLYFTALTRTDASVVALLFCLYPLFVTVAAVALGRERASARRGVALAGALVGTTVVLGTGEAVAPDTLGALLALGAALVYTCYILVGHAVAGPDPLAFTALVCTGAFLAVAAWVTTAGEADLTTAPRAWGWLVLIALVSTVLAILLFFAGLARVGPSAAALLSTVEPVVTVGGAALVFGESLTAAQVAGGVAVLGAVALMQAPARGRPQPVTTPR